MGLTAILFDFDGCILDTMKRHGLLAANVMNKYFGMPVETAIKRYHETTGIPFPKQLENIFPNKPDKWKPCADEYVRRKTEEVFNKAVPFPDVKEMLKALKKKGVLLVISSSTEADMINRIMEKFGLDSYVKHVYGEHEGGKPDHVKDIEEKYNPETVVFVGDSTSDVKMNQKAERVITVGRAGPESSGMLSKEKLIEAGANIATDDLRVLAKIMDFSEYRGKNVIL